MKKQSSLEDEGWIKVEKKYEDDIEREVVPLAVGECIKGKLTGRKTSDDYGYVYYIKVENDPVEKVICGHVLLNADMENVEDGELVIIERLDDTICKNGKTAYTYQVHHKEGD